MSRFEGCIGKGVDGLVVFPVQVEGGFTNAILSMGGRVAEAERGLYGQRDPIESVGRFSFEGAVKGEGLLR